MRKRIMTLVVLASFATVFSTSCCSSLGRNIWRGFGESIGAVPAAFVTNFVATTLGINISG
jgi:hypothetical protein